MIDGIMAVICLIWFLITKKIDFLIACGLFEVASSIYLIYKSKEENK